MFQTILEERTEEVTLHVHWNDLNLPQVSNLSHNPPYFL